MKTRGQDQATVRKIARRIAADTRQADKSANTKAGLLSRKSLFLQKQETDDVIYRASVPWPWG